MIHVVDVRLLCSLEYIIYLFSNNYAINITINIINKYQSNNNNYSKNIKI
jgi:hypothetical protein